MIVTELLHRVGKVALLKHIASPVAGNELVGVVDMRNKYEIDGAAPTTIVPVPDFPAMPTRVVPVPDFLTESCINGQSGAYVTP